MAKAHLQIFDMGVRLFLALREISSIASISIPIIRDYKSAINQCISYWFERVRPGVSFPHDKKINCCNEVLINLCEKLKQGPAYFTCEEITKRHFYSDSDTNELVCEIVRNDVIQWTRGFMDSDIGPAFPEIYVDFNPRQSVPEIELKSHYHGNWLEINIPAQRPYTVEKNFIELVVGLKLAVFHEVISHLHQEVQQWQKHKHEIFIDGLLFMAQLVFCMEETKQSDIGKSHEDALLNGLLIDIFRSSDATGLPGFTSLESPVRDGYEESGTIIYMLSQFDEHLRVYAKLCAMLLKGQPHVFAVDSSNCGHNFWPRFVSALTDLARSKRVTPPSSWMTGNPEILLTVNAWREFIKLCKL